MKIKRTMTVAKAALLVEGWDFDAGEYEGIPDLSEYGLSEDEIGGIARAIAEAVAHALREEWQVVEFVVEEGEADAEVEVYVRPVADVMVGWFLDEWRAAQYEVDGGEGDLHMSVIVLGDVDDLTLEQQRTLVGVVSEVVSDTPALYGYIEGTGTFPQAEGGSVWWAEPHLVGLTEFRERLVDAVTAAGIPFEEKFPTYQPHITLAYLDEGAEPPAVTLPESGSIIVDEITVAIGGSRHTLAFAPVDSDAYDEWSEDRYGKHFERWPSEGGSAYVPLVKSVVTAERRFTLGPWYLPTEIDAHDEWTDPDTLQAALWNYVDSGYRTIHLQHSPEIAAGRWVEIMTLPFALEIPVIDVNEEVAAHIYPAGTVLMGVIWEEWAWELVKSGAITGYSIGGNAQRVDADPDDEAAEA